jgi:hypothetical protein
VYGCGGTAVAQWLRYCATNRKVASSIPDGVIGTFYWHTHSDSTIALGSTQPLTEMSTRSISWGKYGRWVGLTTLPPSCAFVMKSGNLIFLESSGPLQACDGISLPLLLVVCFVCFYLVLSIMYSYCYVYLFLLLCIFRSRYSVHCVVLCIVCV